MVLLARTYHIVEGRQSHNTLLTFIAQNYDGTKDVL